MRMPATHAATRVQRRQLVCLMLVVGIFYIVGSSYGNEKKPTHPGNIRGQIIVDIVQWLPHEVHHMFLMVPHQGTIARFSGPTPTEISEASLVTHCQRNPASDSPGHKFVAECRNDGLPVGIGSKSDQFILRRTGETTVLYQSVLGQQISGFLWSPDSHAIAVLTQNVRVSWNPRYWFYALSGHPVQFETYQVHAIGVDNLSVTSFKVPLEEASQALFVASRIAE
jgi:hypothetical protein